MQRAWMWAQLIIAWLPMWALFTAMIVIMHGIGVADAAIGSARMIAPGAALGILVYKFAERTRWPHPFRVGFIGLHILAAAAFASIWYAAICGIDAIVTGQFSWNVGPGYLPFLVTGIWLYVVVASSAYATIQAQRASKLEAHAMQMQLHTLRAQLHPHFLFNALHTVVQLIPLDARAAGAAAEQLAAALRTAIEEKRDRISLAEEWAFVQRYLAIERIRFGERLCVVDGIDMTTKSLLIPSFALQTLVRMPCATPQRRASRRRPFASRHRFAARCSKSASQTTDRARIPSRWKIVQAPACVACMNVCVGCTVITRVSLSTPNRVPVSPLS